MKYNTDHHRRTIRLREYDYSMIGAYFVTICTYARECILGDVTGGEMHLNDIGRMVEHVWLQLPERFPRVALDEFVIMPNHFHGIICIVGAPLAAPLSLTSPDYCCDSKQGAASGAPKLGAIIRVFKSISAIDVNRVLNRQACPLWQRNYYERVIRNDTELAAIREYVHYNSVISG